jgi:hypothetical protein
MSKVIDHKTIWYQEIASRDYYLENDLERTIMVYLELIFPDYRVFPFKQDLLNPLTGKKSAADLGMVKIDYSEWYVIEVELGKHTKKEVVEQIETFRNFKPSVANAEYIDEKRPGVFDLKKLTTLVLGNPKLMVIVNEYKEDWKADLSRLSCEMCIFQIYNDFSGRRMYRLDGEYPFIFTNFCNCKYEKTLPNTVRVLKKDFLDGYGIKDGDSLTIEYLGVNYIWEREDAGSEVYLICKSSIPPLDPLSPRYRLNYNTSILKATKKVGVISNFLDLFRKNTIPQKRNIFTFVKD